MYQLTMLIVLTMAMTAAQAELRAPVTVSIVDADTGKPTQAVVCLYGADEEAVIPENATAVFTLPTEGWSGGKPGSHKEYMVGPQKMPCSFFATDGEFSVTLPYGDYTIKIVKGTEYEDLVRTFTANHNSADLTYEMKRWINMKERGWYSFDEHLHGDANEVAPWMDACDLNGADVLSVWNTREWEPLRPYPYKQVPPPALASNNQEVERHGEYYGALHFLNMSEFLPLDMHRMNALYIDDARAKGAIIGYAGIMQLSEFAVDVALGKIDYWCHQGNAELYVDALNSGFKLPMADGTRNMVGRQLYGSLRNYVQVDGPFNYDSLCQSIKEGKTMRTQGAVGFITVNGKGIGETVNIRQGKKTVNVEVEAHYRYPIKNVSIIRNGETVLSVPYDGDQRTVTLKGDVDVPESSWISLRVDPGSCQTSPIYVLKGKKPVFVRDSVERMLALVDEFAKVKADEYGEEEKALIEQAREVYKAKLAE